MRVNPKKITNRSAFGLGLTLCVILAFGSCGDERDTVTSKQETLEWSLLKRTGPKQARLVGEVGYCVGTPKPSVQHVMARYAGNRAFLKLLLSPQRPVRKCRGVGLFVYKTVTLRRNLDQLILLDSSTDPPERRWPDE